MHDVAEQRIGATLALARHVQQRGGDVRAHGGGERPVAHNLHESRSKRVRRGAWDRARAKGRSGKVPPSPAACRRGP